MIDPRSPSFDRFYDESVRLELATAQAAAGALREQLQRLLAALTTRYIALAGGTGNPLPEHHRTAFRDYAVGLVDRLQHTLRLDHPGLLRAILRALGLGQDQARAITGTGPTPIAQAAAADIVLQLADTVRADLLGASAAARLLPLDSYRDVTALYARANQAANRLERDLRTAINTAVNQGLQDEAERAGAARLWIPERDACLTCLAYAGQTAAPGQLFPAGLTYGDSSTVKTPTPGPPAHPNCRCRAVAYLGMDDDSAGTYPDALIREAERTVLRGWAGASEPARVRAADRLLQAATRAPKTVRDKARRAVRRGTFAR
jgi:hypothetical protein